MIEDCTAIILAGGDSQRMGRDKADLILGEQTLLQRVIATMQQIFPQAIVSVRQPRPGIDLLQVCDEPANEEKPVGAGPLAGLAAGLGHVDTPWAFVVACDMPFVEPAMVELLGGYRGQHQAVVPVVQGHPQTLAAYYARSCLDTIHAHLAGGGKNSLRAVLEKLQVRYVDETELLKADPALRSFFDLDTQQDFATAMQHYRGRGLPQ
ncbi:MAG: molybdenum cofactor guanylyltransferase [Gallionella sp.]